MHFSGGKINGIQKNVFPPSENRMTESMNTQKSFHTIANHVSKILVFLIKVEVSPFKKVVLFASMKAL